MTIERTGGAGGFEASQRRNEAALAAFLLILQGQIGQRGGGAAQQQQTFGQPQQAFGQTQPAFGQPQQAFSWADLLFPQGGFGQSGFSPAVEATPPSLVGRGADTILDANIANAAREVTANGGWKFPTLDSNNTSTILTAVDGGSNRYFSNRSYNGATYLEQTNGTAAEGLREMINNPGDYTIECAAGANLVMKKGLLDTIGDARFNALYPDGIDSLSWFGDIAPSSADYQVSEIAGEFQVPVNGQLVGNLPGEIKPYDIQNDTLEVGELYYFDKPGDRSTALQGWNAIYLGQNPDGSHQFYAQGAGIVTTDLTVVQGGNGQNFVLPDNNTIFGGTYLGGGSSKVDPGVLTLAELGLAQVNRL